MKHIILFISILFLAVSCTHQPKMYKTADGYCYQDDDLLWHILIYNTLTGTYEESTSSSTPSYDSSTTYTVEETGVQTESSMSETTGESVGGSDSDSSPDSGMTESSGSDVSSDSGSSDSGSSDAGGE